MFLSGGSRKESTSKVILGRIQSFVVAVVRSPVFVGLLAGGCLRSLETAYIPCQLALLVFKPAMKTSHASNPSLYDSPTPLSDGENFLLLKGYYD